MFSRIARNLLLGPLAMLAACAISDPPGGPQAGVPLRVGLSGDYPPFCLASTQPDAWLGYQGFDLGLLQRLTRDLNLSAPQAVPFQWPNLTKTLASQAVDLALCGITIRPDRAPAMLFTRPYAVGGAVAVLPRQKSAQFTVLDDLNQPGIRLGVNAGGHLERVARSHFPRAAIQTTRNNLALQTLLRSGGIDAVISDTFEAATWADVAWLGPFTRDRKALALPLDQGPLRDRINEWLAAREQDGWLAEQRRRLGNQAALSPAEVCAEAVSASLVQRFSLMPLVAAVKRRDGIPISDPEQEAKVLRQVQETAVREGLPESETARLFSVLMDLAKSVQGRDSTVNPDGFNLADLRRAVAGASGALLPEIRRCAPLLAEHPQILEATLRRDLGQWLNADEIGRLLDALPPTAFGSPPPQK